MISQPRCPEDDAAEMFPMMVLTSGTEKMHTDEILALKIEMEEKREKWRCYHCWTKLESKEATCRYCKEATIPRMPGCT